MLRCLLLVCLPAFKVMPYTVSFPCRRWCQLMIQDLHPALPGQFNGANAIHRAYAAFQNKEIDHTGTMIHYVISEVDMGEPIVVKEIDMREGESEEELEQRIHEAEWELIVEGTGIAIKSLWSKRREKVPEP
jgi:phosphoribosylglycinamide formyltransferase